MMSAEAQDLSAHLFVVEHPHDLLRHFPRLMPGHFAAHFGVAASRGEVDMIPSQFGDALVKERTNPGNSIGHIFPLHCLDSGTGHSTGAAVNPPTNILMVNGISPTPTEQGEAA